MSAARRPEFRTRTFILSSPAVQSSALAVLSNAPIDAAHPLELVLREEKKTRKLDQNAAMWSGPLRDIAEQAWVDGRLYSAEVWHEFYKKAYLPEDDDPELPQLAKDGYRKWAIDPIGESRADRQHHPTDRARLRAVPAAGRGARREPGRALPREADVSAERIAAVGLMRVTLCWHCLAPLNTEQSHHGLVNPESGDQVYVHDECADDGLRAMQAMEQPWPKRVRQ